MATNLDNRALNSIGLDQAAPGQYAAAFNDLKTSIDNLEKPLADMVSGITAVNKTLFDTGKSGDDFSKTVQGVAEAFNSWNTVKGTVEAVGDAVGIAEAEMTGGLSAILAAVVAFGPAIVGWAKDLFSGKDSVDKTKLSVDLLNKSLDSTDYSNAIKQYDGLQVKIKLGQKGVLDQKTVLEEYNNSIGKTTGKVKSLDQAEADITQKGPKYIEMTLMKARAQAALQNAVAKQIESEKSKLKQDDEVLTKGDKFLGYARRLADFSLGLPQADADAFLASKAAQRRREESAKADDEKERSKKEFDDLEENIAQFAKKNHLNDPDKKPPTDRSTSGNDNKKARLAQSLADAEQMKKDSIARQLQITTQGYGAELIQENAHYTQQLTSLDNLLKKKLIEQSEYNQVKQQLESEHHAAVGSIIDKFNAEDADKAQQALNELAELQIKGMEDGSAKQIAELNQQQQVRNQQYEKIKTDDAKRLSEIQAQVDAAKKANPDADLTGLQNLLDKQMQIIALHNIKRVEDEDQTTAAIQKIKDKAADDDAKKANDNLLKNDQTGVDDAKNPDAKKAAQEKLVTDKYAFEISQAEKHNQDTVKLKGQLQKDLASVDSQFDQQKQDADKKKAQQLKDFEVQTAQQVSSAAFSVIKNSISQQADAKVKQLEIEKNSELANTSLTSAQKQAITQDFQKKEAAIKIKAFKDEQLASIGQALINGALAITKVSAQAGMASPFLIPGIIAETAIQVATITAQKPPAYARGGMHYNSDGRGGVLSGYSRTDNTNAHLRSGEGIVVSEAMRVPWARNLVSAINVGFGGRDFSMPAPTRGFAVGGIFTDGGDANRYYNQPVHDQKNLANTVAYQMVNNFPPVYVDVKDINNQQNILAQTINRVNL